jgi:hypothetical protein
MPFASICSGRRSAGPVGFVLSAARRSAMTSPFLSRHARHSSGGPASTDALPCQQAAFVPDSRLS